MKFDKLHAVLFLLAALSISSTAYIGIKENYHYKIMAKFGYEYHPVNWAVRGWTNCLEKLNHHSDIVFFGDSITAGSDFQKAFPDKSIANLGFPGDTINGMIDRVPMIKAMTPNKIFIMAGVNGMNKNSITQYEKLISIIRKDIPLAKIYIQSILPIEEKKETFTLTNNAIRNLNNSLKALCSKYEIQFINIYPLYEKNGVLNSTLSRDGIHLKKEAYHHWESAIKIFI